MNTDLNGGAVGFVLGDALDVDDPLLSVDLKAWVGRLGICLVVRRAGTGWTYLDDLSLTSLVFSTDNENLVIFSDWHGSYLKKKKV